MARIRSFTQVESPSSLHPTEVDALWSVVRVDGDTLVQLSTLGSDWRVSGPKVSQTFQIDRKMAVQLMQILDLAFPSSEETLGARDRNQARASG